MKDVHLEKINEVYIRVKADPNIKMELNDKFEFYVPNYQYMEKYKLKIWDGKIRLLNMKNGMIYLGLAYEIKKWCKENDYSISYDDGIFPTEKYDVDIGYKLAEKYDAEYLPYDYQNQIVSHMIAFKRALFLSPTASGKSFAVYLLSRYYVEKKKRVLIICPRTSLVGQMAKDFEDYNKNRPLELHEIREGSEKRNDCDIVISTWQAIQNQEKDWYKEFGAVICDEAHQFQAKTMKSILENTVSIEYKCGLTGSLDDSLTHKYVLEGLFGPVLRVATTKELIDRKIVAKPIIKCSVLKYSDENRKRISSYKFQKELDFIVKNEKRNKFIKNLAHNIEGNTLILYEFVEKHGNVLLPLLREKNSLRIHYVHGDISADERNEIRAICEESDNNIVLASYGTFSTGINIKRINNIIFSSPYKSKIRLLQSIGRGLRMIPGIKEKVDIYDIVDDFQYDGKMNYAIKHFLKRVEIYDREEFEYKIYNLDIEE